MNAKNIFSATLAFYIFSTIPGYSVERLTQSEAFEIVAAREAASAERKAEIRAKIETASVAKEFVHQNGHRRVILRRVHRPAFSIPKEVAVAESHPAFDAGGLEMPGFSREAVQNNQWEMISFSAYRYDDLYAAITWREQGASESYTLWTNIPLKFLPALNSFESDGVHYDYFGFVYEISREIEEKRAKTWEFHGQVYESRWKTPPITLSATEPEYVVVASDPSSVPDKLFKQMDALFGYYLENEVNLQVAHENMEKLSDARAAYREANPPDPTEESVTIFWPIKNSRYLNDTK